MRLAVATGAQITQTAHLPITSSARAGWPTGGWQVLADCLSLGHLMLHHNSEPSMFQGIQFLLLASDGTTHKWYTLLQAGKHSYT